jgi:hypothetical protein
MGIEKSELKKAILQDMGIKADDRLDALTAELHRTEGGAKALTTAAGGLENDVFARLRRDLDEGKIDTEAAKQVDRYLRTCVNMLQHLAKRSKVQVPVMQGRVDEAREAVHRIKKDCDAEEAKILAVRLAEAAGEVTVTEEGDREVVSSGEKGPSRRPVGVRPTGTLKAQRAAEETSEGQETPVAATAPPEPAPEVVPVSPERPLRPVAVTKTAPKAAPVPVAPKPAPRKPKPRVEGETPEDKKAARREAAKKKRAEAAKTRGKGRK